MIYALYLDILTNVPITDRLLREAFDVCSQLVTEMAGWYFDVHIFTWPLPLPSLV